MMDGGLNAQTDSLQAQLRNVFGMQPESSVPTVTDSDTAVGGVDVALSATPVAAKPVSVSAPSSAVKYDAGKLPLELVPFDAVSAIAEILQFGAKKYAARNWELGMGWGRVFGACLRHLWAWWLRKGTDQDTGKSHLWHAGCCIMFLIAYELRGVGTDDRP